MKKKIFLNLVMGTALIATPALLLASCSAQESGVKLPITVKDSPDGVLAEEVSASKIALTTVQKLFNIEASDFNNVTATLNNTNIGVGETNQIVLKANKGFVFKDGTNTLKSIEFTISKELATTIRNTPGIITVSEVKDKPITMITVQKLFNIEASDVDNVTAKLKNGNVGAGQKNQVVLTANDGFVFKNGAKFLDSVEFSLSNDTLTITAKPTPGPISNEEISAGPLTLATVQKVFNNVDADNFKNVTATLKNPAASSTNQVILTAKDDFIFKDGLKTLYSVEFSLSKQLPITAKAQADIPPIMPYAEISAVPIALSTIQILFNNVDASNFANVTVSLAEAIGPNKSNQVILTAKAGFIFENGTDTLISAWFSVGPISK